MFEHQIRNEISLKFDKIQIVKPAPKIAQFPVLTHTVSHKCHLITKRKAVRKFQCERKKARKKKFHIVYINFNKEKVIVKLNFMELILN